jgi:hypothetical protein
MCSLNAVVRLSMMDPSWLSPPTRMSDLGAHIWLRSILHLLTLVFSFDQILRPSSAPGLQHAFLFFLLLYVPSDHDPHERRQTKKGRVDAFLIL